METTLKPNTSIRCDLHPPMSAVMYCDHCKKFLCRICAETRTNGARVCASCKKPCRQPSADEFSQLVVQRQRAKEDARLAKEAEQRIKDQLEKAKQDRDARLKAEFAAKKALWAQQGNARAPTGPVVLPEFGTPVLGTGRHAPVSGTGRQAPVSGTGRQVPVSGTGRQVPVSGTARHTPVGGTARLTPVAETMYEPPKAASRGESMYDPNAMKREVDPLAKLGERSHLNVIERAKSWMIWIGIVTVLVHGFYIWWISDLEQQAQHRREEFSIRNAEEVTALKSQLDSATSEKRREELKMGIARKETVRDAAAPMEAAVTTVVSFVVKAVLGCFVAIGALMIALAFLCEQFPRGATTAAFIVYLGMTLLAIIFAQGGGIYFVALREIGRAH